MSYVTTIAVCVECFADDFLRDLVRRKGEPAEDDEEPCYFCGTCGEPRLDPEDLADRLEAVVRRLFKPDQEAEMVQQAGSGEPLGDLLRDSLGALNPNIGDPDELVRAILGGRSARVHQDDVDNLDLDSTWLMNEDDWTADPSYADALDTLRGEVLQLGHAFHVGPGKHVCTDGIHAEHAYGRIKRALELTAVTLEPGTKIYRARLDVAETKRSMVGEFQAPPVTLASAARANVQGERVWYLAKELETARAELRPALASEVSVAEFILRQPLRLCGLDRRLLETSPFDDIEKYVKEKAVADVAKAMGDLFARPIRPTDTATEYLITQLLARIVRDDGFDGIAFPSSQNAEGLNYVLFDPTLQCDFGPVQTFRCDRVSYGWSEPAAKRAPVRRPAADDDDDFDEDRYDEDE